MYSKGKKRTAFFDSGLQTYLPSLTEAFLAALEQAATLDKKRVPFAICLSTFKAMASEVYPDGAVKPEVKQYVQAFYGLKYAVQRGGKLRLQCRSLSWSLAGICCIAFSLKACRQCSGPVQGNSGMMR